MTDSKKTVFITGNSSGLGYGLSEAFLAAGWEVYGCSRRGCDLEGVHDAKIDLADYDALPGALDSLLADVERLDCVILNAGVLGEIKDLVDTSLDDLRFTMEVNLWAQKMVMDWLHGSGKAIDEILMVSSGAAVNGNRGWGGYALSKAAFVMLGQLYAHEFPDTHILSVAPGLVDTPMQDYLCDPAEVDDEKFQVLKRLRAARGTEGMPKPRDAGQKILELLPRFRDYPSGGFVDIRKIDG